MFKYIKEYWGLISEYVNPVSVILAGILWSLLFFAVITALVIVFRKTILLKRKYKILKVLAISYFVIIPLLAGFFGFQWGALNSAQNQIKKKMPDLTYTLNKAAFDVFISSDKLSHLSADNYIDVVSQTIADVYTAKLEESVGFLKGKHISDFTSFAVKKAIRKTVTKYMGKNITEDLMSSKLNQLKEVNVMNVVAVSLTDKFFSSLKGQVLLFLLLALLIPCVEVAIAYALVRKEIIDSNKKTNFTPDTI